jgi:hypothetical protein
VKRIALGIALGLALFACASTSSDPGGSPAPEPDAGGPYTGGTGGAVGIDATPVTCDPASGAPDLDEDGDGFTRAAGDCNDCQPEVNPGALDVPGDGVDQDCSGTPDDEVFECDEGIDTSDDPFDAARALGLCRKASGDSWGVVEARWVYADGSNASLVPHEGECPGGVGAPPNAESRGVLPGFGPNVAPRAGSRLLALSTGVARPGTHGVSDGIGWSPGNAVMCRKSLTPPGFPVDSPSCPGVKTADDDSANDAIALELSIRVPTNARGFSFNLDFYTWEWPCCVCQKWNDTFVTLLESSHPDVPANRNISFDSQGNVVSVNNAHLRVCAGPTSAGGKLFTCALGTSELAGTGFESGPFESVPSHGATGWLETSSPVVPGELIKLRFAIWEMGDEILDSTVLLDAFRWSAEPLEIGTVPVPH